MTDQSAGHQTIAQLLQQGLFHHRRGEIQLAMDRYAEVLSKDPQSAEALYYVAVIACQEGQFKQGVDLVRRAMTFVPPEARMLNLLGQALDRLGQPVDAIKAIDQAIALDPKLAAAHGNRANLLVDAGMPAEALKSFDTALTLNPDSPPDLINRGTLLELFGRPEDALKDYDRAIKIDPTYHEVYANRASVLKDIGLLEFARGAAESPRFAESIKAYDHAIKLSKGMHELYAARGMVKLMAGDWPGGFADYEHRADLPKPTYQALPDPRWDGSAPRDGEHLVLVGEQGLGDIINFACFAPLLAAQGHKVTVLARKGMAPLLSTLQNVTIATDASELKQPFRWLPLMSVPGVLGITPTTLALDVPYLSADPARVKAWADKLGTGKFKIGINWAPGHADRTQTSRRDIELKHFAPLAALPGVELISLQKGAPAQQIAGVAFRDKIRIIDTDPGADTDMFLDTAAVMSQLDLVISCDTSVPHLAGALGRPVFTALSVIPDWRWMPKGDNTPWYPTMRLFRQGADRQWGPVLEKITAAVKERIG